MSNAQDFLNTIPSIMSVRSRLAVFASNTEAGELNTLLNDAYEEIGHLRLECNRLTNLLQANNG
jgi:HAMP domain-containing protein